MHVLRNGLHPNYNMTLEPGQAWAMGHTNFFPNFTAQNIQMKSQCSTLVDKGKAFLNKFGGIHFFAFFQGIQEINTRIISRIE